MTPVVEHTVRWHVPERNRSAEKRLQEALGIPSLVAAVLVARGYSNPEDANAFLNPSLDDLGAPQRLPDFELAKNAILGAKERGETIYVHGDYDVDGVTSAALLTRFLRSIDAKVEVHVPHRMKEGYGIHLKAVEMAKELGAKLFLTCDCGVSAIEQVEAAKAAGMTVVITDHHTIGHELPKAHAIVNPHRKESEYPFRELSGVGVAFRLCEGISDELGIKKQLYRRAFLDLAVLGTVADVMPLVGENRIITRHGLVQLYDTRKTGLRALLLESNVLEECGGKLTARHIGFQLGPRLNASGRIDDAARSLNLLMESDQVRAGLIAREIEGINRARREEQDRMIDEAVEYVMEHGLHEKSAIVVARDSWHPGIIGLVAGRLVEKFRRPSFVVSIDPESGMAKGSARSIEGFNLAEVIRAHSHLVSGGGHAMAAGFSTEADLIAQVAKAFESYASERLTDPDFEITVAAEAEIEPGEAGFEAVRALSRLEPFGAGNPEPLFLTSGVRIEGVSPTKNPAHAMLQMRAADGQGPLIRGTAFSQGERLSDFSGAFNAQILFQPEIEAYKGSQYLKWHVRHFEPKPD